MIKVGLVSHSPHFAGAEKMLYNLAHLLKDNGNYVPVVMIPAIQGESRLGKACQASGICHVTYNPVEKYIYISEDVLRKTKRDVIDLSEEYVRMGIDMVVCNTATSIVPILAAKRLGKPVVIWIHGILDGYLVPSEDMGHRLTTDRLLMALSDHVLCCSHWTAAYYRPLSISPVKTLHNWVPDVHYIEPINDSDTFICLNSFEENKGVYTAIEAARILKERRKIFALHFYGDGLPEVKQKMLDMITEYGLENHVAVKNRISDTHKAYNSCLCLIQPSYIESFSLTLVEAMAHKRPVIASKSGGPQEIVIDAENGFLFERKNAEQLAEKMESILEHKAQAIQMGARGHEIYLAKFSADCARKSFSKLLDSVRTEFKGNTKVKQLLYDSLIQIYTVPPPKPQPPVIVLPTKEPNTYWIYTKQLMKQYGPFGIFAVILKGSIKIFKMFFRFVARLFRKR